jgi:hypothetical protein
MPDEAIVAARLREEAPMGRTWNALKRDSVVPSETEPSCALPGPAEDAEPMLVDPEEIPFIEVGPKKSIEASPSVLAYENKKEQAGRKPADAPLAPSKPPAPRKVSFRAVFLASPETEAETPQSDA